MDDQQEQKPKKRAVDRINDLANAYKWGRRARHPIQTYNAAKQNVTKLGNTIRHPISAARTAMGIGQAAQGASEAGAVSTGTGTAGTAGGTAGATAASTGGVAGSASAAGSAGVAGTGAATTAAGGATGAASAAATGAQAVAAGTTTALGAGVFASFIIFAAIFFMAFIILFPGFAGTGEGAPIPPGGGVQANLSCNLPPTGPPSGNGSDCLIRGGTVTLGSFCAQKAGDGHCTPTYLASYPENTNICVNSNTGTQFGLDIGSPNGTPIILPRINNKVISYSLITQEDTGNGFIQYYDGTDPSTGTLYRLQLHHTSSGSGRSGSSGDRGGVIGALGHVHVQLALRKATGLEWVDAPLWFCN